jgi:hypothetical protein
MLAVALSLTVCKGESPASPSPAVAPGMPAQAAGPAGGDSAKCPLRAAALDKLTPHHWQFGQYQADRVFIPSGTIRIDFCELLGKDAKGQIRTGLMVNIAKGANADAFAKYWRAVCAESLMVDARGKVQPVDGVAGGYRCVTANGSSTLYWLESPGRTIQIEPGDDPAAWAAIFPRLLAAVGP